MGSGKSQITKILGKKINFEIFDLDHEISKQEAQDVADIFSQKGEIYFRKQEKKLLEHLLSTKDDIILSVGGGTPAYYNNIETINAQSTSIFLRTSVATLTQRLVKEKAHRPLISRISDEDLPEFIAKHLFERNTFYNQAKYSIDTDHKTPGEISDEIIQLLDL